VRGIGTGLERRRSAMYAAHEQRRVALRLERATDFMQALIVAQVVRHA
jgi:hypothetical protein